MRRARKDTLAYTHEGVQLSQREVETLRSASRIAERARDLARQIDNEFDDSWADLDLAHVEHLEFEDGWIPVTQRPPISSNAGSHWKS